ncbi:MAG: ABC transporter permease [Rikenellaceae bacterium]|nr:ABC transporter permease [Rikenellaceae bacterium]
MLWGLFARRYIFSPKSNSVINIIACISLIAVAVPTAAMIILLSMFDGLSSTIERLNAAIDADMEVVAARGQTFALGDVAIEQIASCDGVEAVAPYIEQSVMASSAGRRTTIVLRGVDNRYFDVVALDELLQAGRLESIYSGDILLGVGICSELGAYGIGTQIELYALNRRQMSTLLPMSGISRMTTHLGGAVMGNNDISSTLAIGEIGRVQSLLNYNDRVSAIAIRAKDGAEIAQLEHTIEALVGEDMDVVTREEKYASTNAILRMERFAILLIGSLIVLIATFSIVGTVLMLITEKRRDIATLRALGAKHSLIVRIFTGEGALLTLAGVLLGTLLGTAIALAQQHFAIVKIPGDQFLGSYPVELNIGDIAVVVMVVIATGSLVSWLTVRAKLKDRIARQ